MLKVKVEPVDPSLRSDVPLSNGPLILDGYHMPYCNDKAKDEPGSGTAEEGKATSPHTQEELLHQEETPEEGVTCKEEDSTTVTTKDLQPNEEPKLVKELSEEPVEYASTVGHESIVADEELGPEEMIKQQDVEGGDEMVEETVVVENAELPMAYTIEEGEQGHTIETEDVQVVMQEVEHRVLLLTQEENGQQVQQVIEVPYLEGVDHLGQVIVYEAEGMQYIITDENTEFVAEDVAAAETVVMASQDAEESTTESAPEEDVQIEESQDHVVVEKLQYHDVPFIPPNAGGGSGAGSNGHLSRMEEVESQEDMMEEDAELTPGEHVEYQDDIPCPSAFEVTVDDTGVETSISGGTRAKLIERLAIRLDSETKDERARKKQRSRKSESDQATPKKRRRKKVASTSEATRILEPLKVPQVPGMSVDSIATTDSCPNNQKSQVLTPGQPSPKLMLATPIEKVRSKSKKVSPIQKRHPTLTSLLSLSAPKTIPCTAPESPQGLTSPPLQSPRVSTIPSVPDGSSSKLEPACNVPVLQGEAVPLTSSCSTHTGLHFPARLPCLAVQSSLQRHLQPPHLIGLFRHAVPSSTMSRTTEAGLSPTEVQDGQMMMKTMRELAHGKKSQLESLVMNTSGAGDPLPRSTAGVTQRSLADSTPVITRLSTAASSTQAEPPQTPPPGGTTMQQLPRTPPPPGGTTMLHLPQTPPPPGGPARPQPPATPPAGIARPQVPPTPPAGITRPQLSNTPPAGSRPQLPQTSPPPIGITRPQLPPTPSAGPMPQLPPTPPAGTARPQLPTTPPAGTARPHVPLTPPAGTAGPQLPHTPPSGTARPHVPLTPPTGTARPQLPNTPPAGTARPQLSSLISRPQVSVAAGNVGDPVISTHTQVASPLSTTGMQITTSQLPRTITTRMAESSGQTPPEQVTELPGMPLKEPKKEPDKKVVTQLAHEAVKSVEPDSTTEQESPTWLAQVRQDEGAAETPSSTTQAASMGTVSASPVGWTKDATGSIHLDAKEPSEVSRTAAQTGDMPSSTTDTSDMAPSTVTLLPHSSTRIPSPAGMEASPPQQDHTCLPVSGVNQIQAGVVSSETPAVLYSVPIPVALSSPATLSQIQHPVTTSVVQTSSSHSHAPLTTGHVMTQIQAPSTTSHIMTEIQAPSTTSHVMTEIQAPSNTSPVMTEIQAPLTTGHVMTQIQPPSTTGHIVTQIQAPSNTGHIMTEIQASSTTSHIMTQIQAPVMSSQVQPPVLSSQFQMPVLSSQIQAPTLSSHIQTPVLSSQIQAPVLSSHFQTPVLSSPIQAPTLSSHIQAPVLSSQIQEPVLSSQIQAPVLSSQIQAPVLSSQIQAPNQSPYVESGLLSAQSQMTSAASTQPLKVHDIHPETEAAVASIQELAPLEAPGISPALMQAITVEGSAMERAFDQQHLVQLQIKMQQQQKELEKQQQQMMKEQQQIDHQQAMQQQLRPATAQPHSEESLRKGLVQPSTLQQLQQQLRKQASVQEPQQYTCQQQQQQQAIVVAPKDAPQPNIEMLQQQNQMQMQMQQERLRQHQARQEEMSQNDNGPITLADKYMRDWKPTGKFQCKFCFYSSVTQNFLFRHWVMNHSGVKPYMCAYCNLKSPTKDGVTRHQTSKHKQQPRQVYIDSEQERLLVNKFRSVFQILLRYDETDYSQHTAGDVIVEPGGGGGLTVSTAQREAELAAEHVVGVPQHVIPVTLPVSKVHPRGQDQAGRPIVDSAAMQLMQLREQMVQQVQGAKQAQQVQVAKQVQQAQQVQQVQVAKQVQQVQVAKQVQAAKQVQQMQPAQVVQGPKQVQQAQQVQGPGEQAVGDVTRKTVQSASPKANRLPLARPQASESHGAEAPRFGAIEAALLSPRGVAFTMARQPTAASVPEAASVSHSFLPDSAWPSRQALPSIAALKKPSSIALSIPQAASTPVSTPHPFQQQEKSAGQRRPVAAYDASAITSSSVRLPIQYMDASLQEPPPKPTNRRQQWKPEARRQFSVQDEKLAQILTDMSRGKILSGDHVTPKAAHTSKSATTSATDNKSPVPAHMHPPPSGLPPLPQLVPVGETTGVHRGPLQLTSPPVGRMGQPAGVGLHANESAARLSPKREPENPNTEVTERAPPGERVASPADMPAPSGGSSTNMYNLLQRTIMETYSAGSQGSRKPDDQEENASESSDNEHHSDSSKENLSWPGGSH